MNIELDEGMLISAVRYALPRATYIVAETVRETLRVWERLSPHTRQIIIRDVQEAVDSGATGWDCDAAEWRRLLNEVTS